LHNPPRPPICAYTTTSDNKKNKWIHTDSLQRYEDNKCKSTTVTCLILIDEMTEKW